MQIALYVRVSSARQAVENQFLALRQWAAGQGHEVAGEFADVAPGDSLFRPALRQMIAAANTGAFDAVAIVRPDRLARCPRVLAAIRAQLGDVQLVSLEPGDVDQAVAFAAEETRLIGQRSREGILRARAAGVRIGRPPIPTLAQRLAPRLALAAAGMRAMQSEVNGTV